MGVLGKLLREHEKGILRAARPLTPFQGEYPPGIRLPSGALKTVQKYFQLYKLIYKDYCQQD